MLEIILAGIFAPFILFFFLGIISAVIKADLQIPPPMSVAMVLFLMMAIGLTGGQAAVEALLIEPELLWVVATVALFAMICGPFFAFSTANILKKFAKLKTADAWACGGAYGAVSSVTLAVAVAIASAAQKAAPDALIFVGWMPGMYPFMDSPALITAILLGRIALAREGLRADAKVDIKKLLHLTLFGMAIWILISSLVFGMVAHVFSPVELGRSLDFFDGMFRGVLCLFLLDMGVAAGRQIGALKALGGRIFRAIGVAFVVPQVWGVVGILGVYAVHLAMPGTLGWGDAFVFASIAGGCSYVTAPVAMRSALPEANPSIYLPMAIALTFPFNIIVNMPIWMMICRTLWGA
jgi:hypothetical protein